MWRKLEKMLCLMAVLGILGGGVAFYVLVLKVSFKMMLWSFGAGLVFAALVLLAIYLIRRTA